MKFLLATLAPLLALGASAVAQPKPVAPSTGKELHAAGPPKLTLEQARAAVDQALADFHQPKHDCETIIRQISAAFGAGVDADLTRETEPVYSAFAECAFATGRYMTLHRVMEALLRVDPDYPDRSLLPISQIALGDYQAGYDTSATLLQRHPDDVKLTLIQGVASCKLERWSDCETVATRARGLLKGKPSPGAFEQLDHMLLGEALFHQGRLDASTVELAAVTPASALVEKRLKRNEIVKSSKLAVEPDFDAQVALGTYHLLGAVKGVRPLLTLKLYDFDVANRQVRVEVEIPGVTEKVAKTKLLLRGKRELLEVTPPLRADFPVAALRSQRPAQLAIRVSAGSEVLYEKSYPVMLLPRDSLLLAQRIAVDEAKPTPGFIAAWITPNAPAVDQFLQAAKKRVDMGPFSGGFTGEQHATLPQVRALWDELQAQGVSYVSDPEVLADFGTVQRTRLPSEVLASKNAQCLEGTILFATLMEAVGLRPILVRVPGHAFVGWHPSADDKVGPKSLFFVETTMVHNTRFEEAMKFSRAFVEREEAAGHFAKGILGPSYMIDLGDLRRAGFRPQPVE